MNDNSYDSLQDMVHGKGESRTIRRGGEWILVFNTSEKEADVMANLRELVADLDIEDIRYIDSLLLIGGKRSVKVDSNLAEDLVGDRTRTPDIINHMKEDLERDYGYRLFDRGPHKRLAIRLPIQEMQDFHEGFTARIRQIISGTFSPGNIGNILSVYLIADETYVRLEPDLFFQEIFGPKGEPAPPSGRIILGESPQELIELALKKLPDHEIFRDIQLVEAAGLGYSFDAVASSGDDRIFLKYLDTVKADDLLSLQLFMDAFQADKGWILTRGPKDIQNTDTISIMTIEDL